MDYFLTSDQVKLRYLLQGEGKTLVLLHGWSGNGEDFRPMAERLAKDYQVLLYDHRGHGYSDHPNYGISLSRLALDLKELLFFLQLKDVVLAGWSMGVLVIFEYLKNFGEENVEALILMDSSAKALNDSTWSGGLFCGKYKEEDLKEDISNFFDNPDAFQGKFLRKLLPRFTEERIALLEKLNMESPVPDPSPFALIGLWNAISRADYLSFIKGISLSTRIFRGTEESLFSPLATETIHDLVADSKLISFEGASHLLVLEQPRQVMKEIQHFMEELQP